MKKQEKRQIIFLVMMGIFIFLLAFAIFTLVRNIEYIKNDPIQFGVDKMNYNYCSCMGSDGVFYNYAGENIESGTNRDS